jgi:hypothetical protein
MTVRRLWPWWLAVACLVLAAPAAPRAAVIAVERVSVTVSDLDRTERFYREGLGFITVERRHVEDPSVARLVGI